MRVMAGILSGDENREGHCMELLYKRATIDDIDLLTKTRTEVLRAAILRIWSLTKAVLQVPAASAFIR